MLSAVGALGAQRECGGARMGGAHTSHSRRLSVWGQPCRGGAGDRHCDGGRHGREPCRRLGCRRSMCLFECVAPCWPLLSSKWSRTFCVQSARVPSESPDESRERVRRGVVRSDRRFSYPFPPLWHRRRRVHTHTHTPTPTTHLTKCTSLTKKVKVKFGSSIDGAELYCRQVLLVSRKGAAHENSLG